MQKASFYIIDKPDLKARDLFACKLIEKAYNSKCKIYINASSIEEMQNIDTQLWTFRDISFIPHEIFNNKNSNCQILIGYNAIPPIEHKDVLLNFSSSIPTFCNQFAHIIEIVYNNDEIKKISRQHYKFLQSNNYEIQTHEIKA